MSSSSDNTDDQLGAGSLLRQTLMTQDECFVYKVPPLATASGYRANEWNLAQPLQTCGFQVERRDNDLFLLFTMENHTKLFALSKIADGEHVQRSVEPVLDSSRYFVTKIMQQTDNRTALLGFGFRDRDVAIDLLGNLQQFQKSIQREMEAKHMKVAEIPTLKEGDKMHINLPGGGTGRRKKASTPSSAGGGGPFLLKKPPKVAGASSPTPATAVPQVIVNLSEMEAAPEPMDVEDFGEVAGDAAASQTEDSECAVAKSIIHDFDDIVDGGFSEEGIPSTPAAPTGDDDDFGDFQAA